MLKDTTLGWYEPSFFKLHVSTKEKLDDPSALSPESRSVFVHEYVHFLQDIITSFGLINICNIVNIQKAINAHILQQSDSFEIPLNWEETHSEVDQINKSFDAYWGGQGDRTFDSYSFVNHFTCRDGFVDGFERKIPYMVIKYLRNKVQEECVFGAYELMESMANGIESLMFPNVCPSPEYPYYFVQNIVRYIYPKYANDIVFQVIMCDIALNTYHPGKFFYEMLLLLEKEKFEYKRYQDIYDFANNYTFTDPAGESYDFTSLFEKSVNDAMGSFSDYFTIPDFEPVKNWGTALIQKALSLRKNNPHFWITILEKPTSEERALEFGKMLFPMFGTPLLCNDLDEYVFFQSDLYNGDADYLSSLLGIKEIQEYVSGRTQSCSLQKFCTQTRVDMSKMNCLKPWGVFENQDSSKVLLCPFTMMLKAWGIYAKTPVFAE